MKWFDWKDNGIPEECIDLVHSDGNKRSDSDKVHAKKISEKIDSE